MWVQIHQEWKQMFELCIQISMSGYNTREVAQTCQIQTSIWQLCNLHSFVWFIQPKRQKCSL